METIGIQGGEASYHEIAAHQIHPNADLTYYETFSDVFEGLRKQQVGRAVLAIANNRIQFITDAYEELVRSADEFRIVDETYLRVDHALLAPAGATLEAIEEVHSQSPALDQCRDFLDHHMPHAKIVEQHDTAASAKLISELNDPTKAAIASLKAGQKYGLIVVRTSVQDDPDNITRFVEVVNAEDAVEIAGADKTTMMLKTPQEAGALVNGLLPFKERGINLSNLHSRFIPNTAFDMMFFMELEAGAQEERTKQVLTELQKMGYEYQIMGSYKKAQIPMKEA